MIDYEYISHDRIANVIAKGISFKKIKIFIYDIDNSELSQLMSVMNKRDVKDNFSTKSITLKNINMSKSDINIIQHIIELLKKMPHLKSLSIEKCDLFY